MLTRHQRRGPDEERDELRAQRRTFTTLDGLRGVAAVAVAFRHIPDNAIAAWTAGSYLAVDLFFVLSGFVIAYAYAERLRAGMSVVDFAVTRLIRLYPLYFAASLITLALVLVPAMPGHYHPPPRSLRTVIFAMLFVPTIARHENIGLFPLIGPAWSLFFEFAVNVVFALMATRLDARRLAVVLAGGAALLIATAAYFGTVDVGYTQVNLWGGFGRVGFAFFAGVAAHRLWAADALPWLRLPAWAAAVAVVAMFAIDGAPQPWWDVGLIVVVMPALVLAAARAEPPRWLARPFAVLGVASYALYVLTNPVDQWFETLVPWPQVNSFIGWGSAGAVLFVAATLMLALALDRAFDRPVRAALTATWRRARTRRAVLAAADVVAIDGGPDRAAADRA